MFEEQVKELKALDRPKADKEKLGKMLDNLEAASDDLAKRLKDDPESALSGEDPFAASDKEAQDYGLKECGSSG